VLGHGDFEAQNLRWRGPEIHLVHDWDSLTWQPEAALVGAASGAFANSGQPTLAPITGSEAFLAAYQEFRRPFTPEELEVAWTASLWTPAHNARWEALHGDAPLATTELSMQAAERLHRGNA
jgi:Ser/Thr protein kinase RdoA (MazF antagonist)